MTGIVKQMKREGEKERMSKIEECLRFNNV